MINNPTPEAKLKETPCTKVLNTKVTLHLHHTKKADLKLWQNIYRGRKISSTEQHETIITREMRGGCSLRTGPLVR